MKTLVTTLLMAICAAAPAAASSFVMLKRADIQPSPSIILFVEPEDASPAAGAAAVVRAPAGAGLATRRPAVPGLEVPMPQRYARLSASVIAMGEPAVEPTIVAAIQPEPKPVRNPHLPPMVIRGGLFGDVFQRGDGQNRQPAEHQAPATAEAPGRPAPAAPGQQRQPEPSKAPPPPPPQGPAAPTRLPE